MANYKVIDAEQLDSDLTTVADAIREKGGTDDPLAFPEGFVSAVNALELSGGRDDKLLELVNKTISSVSDETTTEIGAYTFYDCTQLVDVYFPNVVSINSYAFYRCSALEYMALDNVTHIGVYAFAYSGLTKLEIPNVLSVGAGALYNCTQLKTVDAPSLAASSRNMFDGCTSLEKAILPSVLEVGVGTFQQCTALICVDLPSTYSIGVNAFGGCTALKALVLRFYNPFGVCTLSSTNALYNTPIASGEGYIYVPTSQINYYKTGTNWTTYADQFRALEDYTVDGTTTGELDPEKI